MTPTTSTNTVHEGRNIKRFREMMGIKQDALASSLGDDWNQQRISLLEQKETVDPKILQQVSEVLGLPVKAFQDFDEEKAVNIISSNITNNDNAIGVNYNHNPTFNPLDKLLEAYGEIRRLNAELLRMKDEQIALLQKMVAK